MSNPASRPVLLFARAAELAGTTETIVNADTTDSLRSALIQKHPALATLAPHLLIAVNGRYAVGDQRLGPACEIAVFPPVSGG